MFFSVSARVIVKSEDEGSEGEEEEQPIWKKMTDSYGLKVSPLSSVWMWMCVGGMRRTHWIRGLKEYWEKRYSAFHDVYDW